MKAGDRAARNRDETERKQFSRDHQAGAIDELRDRRHFQIRQHEEHAEHQREDRAELHERAEIIARREQQPNRQNARGQPIDDHSPTRAVPPSA